MTPAKRRAFGSAWAPMEARRRQSFNPLTQAPKPESQTFERWMPEGD